MPDTSEKSIALTLQQYDAEITRCREVFIKKNHDYGTAWRILRPPSLTDQIFIKAQRVRTIQENGETKVGEGIEPEFIGVVNYCMMALIQLEMSSDDSLDLPSEESLQLFDKSVTTTRELMIAKNTDYGEAWRNMRVSSLIDLILMKIHRTKQIEDLGGKTLVSEGVDANYMDMANYALFALIKLNRHYND